ncbi:MAG: 5-formyltetrahydrofolate cyclo-ligase [Gammaproteobacteria bacterium]|nr:5-formyltetrahydrofolate cyclo-ligase [Gammaproteobacteria bacterium]
MDNLDRNQLRSSIRQQRRQLSPSQQHHHSHSLAEQLCKHPLFRRSRRIACYLAEDGEIDPHIIINKAWQSGKQVFLPVLPPMGQSLFFAPYHPDSELIANRFNILEPAVAHNQWIRARQLSLILLPLVAFDPMGNRLGMGGGYYDRSLQFTRHRKQWHSPHLIGLAHELQKVKQLPCESWDVPLNLIATEQSIYETESCKL